MDIDQLISEINQMTVTQKLLLTQDIWDSIARSDAQLPFPDWQRQELEKRYGQYKDGSMDLYDWETVHKTLREKQR
ncbi:MAG: addiction module protein [Dissulfuribacterales bacterium]